MSQRDPNVVAVMELMRAREAVGFKKYGVATAHRTDTDHRGWLQHALEECLDQAVYLMAAIRSASPAPLPVESGPKSTCIACGCPVPEGEIDCDACNGNGVAPPEVEWGKLPPKTDDELVQMFRERLANTRAHFGIEGPVVMHGVYAKGTEIVIAETGFGPNAAEFAKGIVRIWNHCRKSSPAPEPQGESREEKCPACGKATSRWVASGSLVEQCCHCGEILGDAPAAPESGERTADNMLHRLWTKAAANANDDYDKAEWLELERLISKPKETADVQLAVEDAGPACVRLDEVGKEAGELRPSSGLQRGLRPVPEGQDGDRVHANMAGADVQGMRQDAARATEALASSPPAGESEMPNKETTCDTSSSAPPLDGSSSATQSPAGQGDSQVPLQASGSDREQAGEMDLSVFEGHTEGPWRIFSTNAARESEIVGPNHGDGREEWIADTFDFGNNESLANARLIAAAPRLLSELKRTREEVQNQKLFGVSQMNEIRSLNSQVATLQARVADAEREVAPARKILEEYMVLKMDWSGDDLNRAMKACRLMVEADNKRIAAEARVADTQRALAEAAEVNEVRAARVAELEREVKQRDGVMADSAKDYDRLRDEIATLRQQLAERDAALKEAEGESDSVWSYYEKTNRDWIRTCKALDAERKEIIEKNTSLTRQLEEARELLRTAPGLGDGDWNKKVEDLIGRLLTYFVKTDEPGIVEFDRRNIRGIIKKHLPAPSAAVEETGKPAPAGDWVEERLIDLKLAMGGLYTRTKCTDDRLREAIRRHAEGGKDEYGMTLADWRGVAHFLSNDHGDTMWFSTLEELAAWWHSRQPAAEGKGEGK